MTLTPEQEALREKVAREIYDILEGPVATQDFGRQTRQWELSLKLARAAVSIALEEAAKVVEKPIAGGAVILADGTRRFLTIMDIELLRCFAGGRAADVRSLIPQDTQERTER